VDYLADIEQVALAEGKKHQIRFKEWASEYCQVGSVTYFSSLHGRCTQCRVPCAVCRVMLTEDTQDARYMNPTSDAQKQQLFFAPCKNLKTDDMMPAERLFDIENDEGTHAQAVCRACRVCRVCRVSCVVRS
jgi:hypothetical protein